MDFVFVLHSGSGFSLRFRRVMCCVDGATTRFETVGFVVGGGAESVWVFAHVIGGVKRKRRLHAAGPDSRKDGSRSKTPLSA